MGIYDSKELIALKSDISKLNDKEQRNKLDRSLDDFVNYIADNYYRRD